MSLHALRPWRHIERRKSRQIKVGDATASVPEVYQPTTSVAITNLVENNLLPPVNQTKDESTFVDNILE